MNQDHKKFKPTDAQGKQSLHDHIVDKALQTRDAYGAQINIVTITEMINDQKFVRFPVEIVFSDAELSDSEFAYLQTKRGVDGLQYKLSIHPYYKGRDQSLPYIIAYYIVCVNYGDIVTSEEAELYGATLFGLEIDDYYHKLCAIADNLGG